MNTRIQELAEQAKSQVPKGILAPDLWIEQYNRIFAELIVRECANIAETAEPFKSSDLILSQFGLSHVIRS